jgi:hypothetical protein
LSNAQELFERRSQKLVNRPILALRIGEEIGFVISQMSTMRTDMVATFGVDDECGAASTSSLRAKRSNP